MPSHNLVLNANLQMMNYGITYLLDGGTGSSLIQTYNIDIKGSGKTIALFSSSYRERDDHFQRV